MCRDAVTECILAASGYGDVRYHSGDSFAAGQLRLQTDPRFLLLAGMNRVSWEIPEMFLHGSGCSLCSPIVHIPVLCYSFP